MEGAAAAAGAHAETERRLHAVQTELALVREHRKSLDHASPTAADVSTGSVPLDVAAALHGTAAAPGMAVSEEARAGATDDEEGGGRPQTDAPAPTPAPSAASPPGVRDEHAAAKGKADGGAAATRAMDLD